MDYIEANPRNSIRNEILSRADRSAVPADESSGTSGKPSEFRYDGHRFGNFDGQNEANFK